MRGSHVFALNSTAQGDAADQFGLRNAEAGRKQEIRQWKTDLN